MKEARGTAARFLYSSGTCFMEREIRCFFSSTSSTTTFTTSPTATASLGWRDELVAHLRNVHQTVLMHADIHEHAEVDDVAHRAGEHHAGL